MFGQESLVAEDAEIFRRTMKMAQADSLRKETIGRVISAIGVSFIGKPYIAHSLEVPGEERLVVNLRAFDCLTFVESTLALARCAKMAKSAFDDFKHELTRIRYRGGILNGYASRLHYFTDWVLDNEQKGVVKDVGRELGGVSVREPVNFMSTHPASYAQLADAALLDSIRSAERRLSSRTWFFIERDRVAGAAERMRGGDIIGMVSSIPGLDVTHTGLAFVYEGTIHFLHAPLSGGAVESSPGSLMEYLARYPKTRGIVVARPLEPAKRPIPQP
jgi:hypothetical protein